MKSYGLFKETSSYSKKMAKQISAMKAWSHFLKLMELPVFGGEESLKSQGHQNWWCGSIDVIMTSDFPFSAGKMSIYIRFLFTYWQMTSLAFDSVGSMEIWRELGVKLLLFHVERSQVWWSGAWAFDKNAYWVPSFQSFLGKQNWVETPW